MKNTVTQVKELSIVAEKIAIDAETLYKKGDLSVNDIAVKLGISKTTLYKYLRHRSVEIGTIRKVAL